MSYAVLYPWQKVEVWAELFRRDERIRVASEKGKNRDMARMRRKRFRYV